MIFQEIALEEIDFENQTFRISEQLDSAAVCDSLREIGQLNPVLLLDVKPQKRIVCGFRRLRALRQLKQPRAVARILDKAFDGRKAFDLALWDNLSHRQLNPLEKARVLVKLRKHFDDSEDALVQTYLPRLDLKPHLSVLRSYLRLEEIHSGLRECFGEERLTLSSLEILAAMPPQSQALVVALMNRIQLSASLQKQFFSLLEDLAAMTDTPRGEILKDSEVIAILDDSRLTPFQRGEKAYEILYRRRYPRVCQARARFVENKKSLGLPGSIRITADPFFETQDLRIEFNTSNANRFRELTADLYRASQNPVLEQLFHVR